MDLYNMRDQMDQIVARCSKKHNGGESYFTELDDQIKNNKDLLVSFIQHVAYGEEKANIVLSGEIGIKCMQIIKRDPSAFRGIRWIFLNGGLRNDEQILFAITKGVYEFSGMEFAFIDDSFYSGKTYRAVKKYIEERGGKLNYAWVFYDGCQTKYEYIRSLYRYYK